MAISATMSLWGLWKYDNTVLDSLQLPAALDPDTVKNNLLMETASLEILYPDPDFLKQAIGIWSEKQLPVWQQLYDTTQYEYDPIANYDRKEHVVETTEGSTTGSSSGESSSTSSGSSSTTSKKTAYNSNAFADSGKTESEGQQTDSSSDSAETSQERSDSRTLDSTVRGNIGVTTTQQMIQSQRDVVQFNVIDHIIHDFITRFCVMVY